MNTTNTSKTPVNTREKKLTSGKITLVLFWLGFTFFLAVSVPHVAWLFHEYENNSGYAIPLWVVSYGVAVSIDVLILWLSYIQTTNKRSDVIVSWLFIITLASLSWYANWLYDMFHNPVSHVDVWAIPLLFNLTTVGTLTPIIVSAIPVFIIGYTFMLSKFSGNISETLEEKATRLEGEKALRQRIREAKQGILTRKIKESISGIGDIASHTGYVATHLKPSVSLSHGQETVPASPEVGTPEDSREGTPASLETVPASSDTPIVVFKDNRVHSVQFPDKNPVIVHTSPERDKTTEVLPILTPEDVPASPATNGHRGFKSIEDILKGIE